MRYLLCILLATSFFVLYADGQTRRARTKTRTTVKATGVVKEAPKPSSEALSFGLTVEKYVSNYELNADGTGRQTLEMQQRCHSDMCLARLAYIKRVYNGKLEKVKLLDAQLLKADGSKSVLPASAYSDNATAQTEAAPGFSSLRELEVRFADLAIGDAAYFKLEIVTVRSNFERRFDALEIFPVLFDWKSIEINVSAPNSYPLSPRASASTAERSPKWTAGHDGSSRKRTSQVSTLSR